jgi:hypothetical protein
VDSIMTTLPGLHHSFIVRCWQDGSGELHGWVIDALTQQAYPFATRQGLEQRILDLTNQTSPSDGLTPGPPSGLPPAPDRRR